MSQPSLTINKLTQSDRRIDEWMGVLLRSGVILAAVTVVAGGLVSLGKPVITVNYRVFQPEPLGLRTIPGILRDAKAISGRGLIQLGLLILIATPIARVAFSVIAFSYHGDLKYVFFTIIVLGLLLYSLIRGG